MISGPAAVGAARLAGLVAWIGDPAWSEELDALAGTTDAPSAAGRPTHGDIARAGTALVAGLVDEARWDEAARQARRLRSYFFATGMELGPIAAQAFDGLLAAVLARDPEEVGDFVDLVAELFS